VAAPAKTGVVIKLGGSVITEKAKPFTVRKGVLERLSAEIGEIWQAGNWIVVVHGGGSFGHPVASRYSLHVGKSSGSPPMAISMVEDAMRELNREVVSHLVKAGIPAVGLQTLGVAHTSGGRLDWLNLSVYESLVSFGVVPVSYGSLVMDSSLGYCILSGDDLAVQIAVGLSAKKLIFATDVEGVYSADPRSESAAVLLPRVSLSRDFIAFGSASNDVTGGMKKKVLSTGPAVQAGVEVRIVNGMREDVLKQAAFGKPLGTEIVL